MITMSNIGYETLLGAQMSSYATLYYLSKELNQELVFFNRYTLKRQVRFRIVYHITDYGLKLYEPFDIPNKLLDGVIKTGLFQKIINRKHYFDKYYPCINNGFDTNIYSLNSKKNYDIQSSFGLYKNWAKYSTEIFNIFSFKKSIFENAQDKIKKIKNLYNTNTELVSVHFRRGDYLLLSSLNLSSDYYIEALNIFQNTKYTFLIFSDDIDYCKSLNFLKQKNIHFIEGNTNHIDMCMMTMCDHNIIANSSFSFWGALLNRNKNKIVVCPKNYIGERDKINQYINANYYPMNWIALNNV